jgi:hypothetical protein
LNQKVIGLNAFKGYLSAFLKFCPVIESNGNSVSDEMFSIATSLPVRFLLKNVFTIGVRLGCPI